MSSESKSSGKILIVDDSPTNLVVLGDYLDYYGFEIIPAMDGKSCYQIAIEEQPDLILLDIMMPGIDGFETMKRLKSDAQTRQIPVIFMSTLSQKEHKLRGFAEGAVDYITKPFFQEEVLARVKTHLTIERQKKQLHQLVATKDKLFSIIAHDLRSPFNALIGYSDLLMQQFREMEAEALLKAIDRINSSSKEAYTLLENLLNWARSQMGTLSWENSDLNLFKLVDSVVSLLKVAIQKKDLQISNEIATEITVFSSQEMLATIIRNLLSNAVKYTRPGGSITIRAKQSIDRFSVSIADTGIGISKQNLSRLFRLDAMFSTAGTEREKGTGLGLILCREFVEKQQGTISVESEENKGTTFTINLPQVHDNPSRSAT